MKAVILATGRGQPWFLGAAPRELLPVMNRPLIQHQLAALREAGIGEVGIVASRAAAAAIDRALEPGPPPAVQIAHIPVCPGTGEAAGLLAAEAYLADGPFVVQLGNTLVLHDVGAAAELLRGKHLRVVVVGPGGGAPALYVLDSETLPAIRESVAGNAEIDMAELVGALARHGRLELQPVTGWSKRIEGIEDLLDVNQQVLDTTPASYAPESLHESSVQGPVTIEPGARIEFSALRGPVAIAAGAYVADAHIGPYTCIGAWAQVERVEMERCVILGGASLENLGARLEASVIGEKAQVSRHFGLPRSLQLQVGEGARLSLV
jgi:glucose-1-phosphate thymidylyltransferase